MTSWWPCCCDPPTYFKPCSAFSTTTSFITSEGWTDNVVRPIALESLTQIFNRTLTSSSSQFDDWD